MTYTANSVPGLDADTEKYIRHRLHDEMRGLMDDNQTHLQQAISRLCERALGHDINYDSMMMWYMSVVHIFSVGSEINMKPRDHTMGLFNLVVPLMPLSFRHRYHAVKGEMHLAADTAMSRMRVAQMVREGLLIAGENLLLSRDENFMRMYDMYLMETEL